MKEKCVEREQFYIDKFRSAERKYGYNICPTAGNLLGLKWPEDAKARKRHKCADPKFRQKISSLFSRSKTEEHKKKLREANLGRVNGPHSEETRRKISAARKGNPFSDEHKKQLSIAAKARFQRPEERRLAAEKSRSYALSHREEMARRGSLGAKKRFNLT
jgi:hypothetical protein